MSILSGRYYSRTIRLPLRALGQLFIFVRSLASFLRVFVSRSCACAGGGGGEERAIYRGLSPAQSEKGLRIGSLSRWGANGATSVQ